MPRLGARLAFGSDLETRYRFDQAAVVVGLDSDFMTFGPGRLRYVRDFTASRRMTGTGGAMSRFYAAECTPTVTGSMADHRLPVPARDVEGVGRAIAAGLGLPVAAGTGPAPEGAHRPCLAAAATDLRPHPAP